MLILLIPYQVKKCLSVILITLSAIISSCKKDKVEVEVNPADAIVGYWSLNRVSTDLYYKKDVVKSRDEKFADVRYIDNVEFRQDGTGAMMEKGREFRRFNYRIEKNEIYFSGVTALDRTQWVSERNSMGIVAHVDGNNFVLAYDTFLLKDFIEDDILYDRYRTFYHFSK